MGFTAADFAALCARGPVAEQIRTIEDRRRKALSRFPLHLFVGLTGAAILAWLVGSNFNPAGGVAAFLVIGTCILIAAFPSFSTASAGIKHPTLHALAGQGGMSFTPTNFEPPAFEEARRALFGVWLNGATFTDLFCGTDRDGKRFAFYEAKLTQSDGTYEVTVFAGQVYAFERSRTQTGDIVAVPNNSLFNLFKPTGGFGRGRIEADEAFDKAFEVHGTDEIAARMTFAGNVQARRLLMELRQRGKVFLFVGPRDVFAAVTGGNRYEPGSMFARRSGEERVRLMFDDVCQAMETVKRLKAVFG
ncbi:MAG TPA: hypothetical protein VGB79_02805 [Allosphingosinicella sp.]|jgi:hypothetical protein